MNLLNMILAVLRAFKLVEQPSVEEIMNPITRIQDKLVAKAEEEIRLASKKAEIAKKALEEQAKREESALKAKAYSDKLAKVFTIFND